MTSKLQKSAQGLIAFLSRHPYALTILICFLLLPFGFGDRANITGGSCLYLGIVLGAISTAVIFFFRLGKTLFERLFFTGMMLIGIIVSMLIISYVKNKAVAIAIIALIAAVIGIIILTATNAVSDKTVIALLIFLGIAIRFVYILYTTAHDRQHDNGIWGGQEGHLGYIEYWYQNGLKLPDFDVRTRTQYYHPPLHHMLMAGLLKVLTVFGVEYNKATEAIQILPMLYSSLSMIIGYRVFRLVKLKGTPLIAATAILCFHPTFIIFGGSYNNDMLLLPFMLGAVMWGLRWYRDPRMGNIIGLALCIGLGMMTKLSGWMVAPAVAFLFLVILIKNIKKPLKYIGQYAIFGVICVPLGLWWQVRNLVKFNVPITFIPDFGPQSFMYSGNLPLTKRLFDFGNGQLSFVYGTFTPLGASYNEYNPTLGLFKTAMFDECNNSINDLHYPQIHVTGPLLFWISVVLFLLCFICFIISMVRKSEAVSGIERIYFAVLFTVVLVSYYSFAISYPHSCTFNIRYAMLLIPLCAMGMGLAMQKTKESQKAIGHWFRRFMYLLTAAFCVMSYLVYTQVGSTL